MVPVFSTCKKYPDNLLLFRTPGGVLARGDVKENGQGSEGNPWILDKYIVNDVDSTGADMVKVYREEGINMYIQRGSPDNYYYDCFDITFGVWEFYSHKKVVVFKFTDFGYKPNSVLNGAYSAQRNIFMESGLPWTILWLDKKHFWITAHHNGSKYEMHFK
ncbi:MAG: hypothetical protein ACXVP0_02515 [Bacteroidia bacterium]